MEHRVVITGTGCITPLGNDTAAFIEGLRAGRCAIEEIKSFSTEGFKAKLAAEVKDFDFAQKTGRKDGRKLDRFAQFAIAAAREAFDMSGIDMANEDETRAGVVIGSGIGGLSTTAEVNEKLLHEGVRKVTPFAIPKMISNMAAGNVSIELGTKGVCQCTVTACASGADAIGLGFMLIKMGKQDVIVAGGSEAAITPLGIAGFEALKALSFATDPARGSIPFDKERNGFIMGEGAGVIVMESLEHARSRGADILAEVVGYGQTSDAYHITAPDVEGEGGKRAMQEAIREAGIAPSEIGYINAHGTSTPYNDSIETLAIKKALGEENARRTPISSTKSMTGHLLGGSGAIEAIACVYAVKDGILPPTIHYQVADEACDLDYITEGARKAEIRYALSNSLGFGGHNASLLLKKWEDE
ncbi:MAG: beta-ketoacyl-ACP synthase II [Eubacteriales bacterium]|nr:beta-ketoacyl-ACP synthase II [Eubacteriales bacterium]